MSEPGDNEAIVVVNNVISKRGNAFSDMIKNDNDGSGISTAL